MQKVIELVKQIANTDTTVLLQGETGTGKELISRLIHNLSKRKKAPFIPVNCAALPKDLLEAELFGYEKGSFTGATQSRRGSFLLAHGGTIFLDEISEMDYDIQAKLLRALQEKEIRRLGSSKTIKIDSIKNYKAVVTISYPISFKSYQEGQKIELQFKLEHLKSAKLPKK